MSYAISEYEQSREIYSEAEEDYLTTGSEEAQDEAAEADSVCLTVSSGSAGHSEWWDRADADIKSLSGRYPEAVGWIWFEDGSISYPLMFSGDNGKYLFSDYTGNESRGGAIFVDEGSSPDLSDPHTLIYGHNMKDGSMFGSLKNFRTDSDYYRDHRYFQIITADHKYRYLIFAFKEVPSDHMVYDVYGSEGKGLDRYLKEMEACSPEDYVPEDDLDISDYFITLSTCTAADEDRFIVCAVRTDEYALD
ncbi:MAG: class B sortase [Lachnospiraceae bacterium]|nr:class B sortase [Lachnospiraceae bacterium]